MSGTRDHDHHFVVDSLRFHVRETGTAGAAPLVMLHGIMGHAREWDAMTCALDAHVFSVDQRGHGMSDWAPSYDVPALAADAAGIIERLDLPTVPVVVGHSMGGMAAIHLAAERPDLVRGLVVVDITPESVTPRAAMGLAAFLTMLAEASHATAEEAMSPWLEGNHLAQPPLLRHYVEHGTRRRADGRLIWRFDGHGLTRFPLGVSADAMWAAVEAIVAPTLVVHGEHSPFVSAEAASELTRRLASGRRVMIPGGGHDLGVEQPTRVATAIASFLEDLSTQAVSR